MSFFGWIPNPLCLAVGHEWGPWLKCRDGRVRRFCNRCEAHQP